MRNRREECGRGGLPQPRGRGKGGCGDSIPSSNVATPVSGVAKMGEARVMPCDTSWTRRGVARIFSGKFPDLDIPYRR